MVIRSSDKVKLRFGLYLVVALYHQNKYVFGSAVRLKLLHFELVYGWLIVFQPSHMNRKRRYILYRGLYFVGLLLWHTSMFSQLHSVILGRPTSNSVTVSVLFNVNTEYFIEAGATPGNLNRSFGPYQSVAGIPDETDITGLPAASVTYYRLKYRGTSSLPYSYTATYQFQTQRASNSTFTFTLESDEHLYDIKGVVSLYRITLQNQAADQPDFMMSLGDIFGDDHEPFTITAAELDSLHKYYRPLLGGICHSIPFYVCLGNHEGEKRYYLSKPVDSNMAIPATLARKKYYPNPYPNGFYTGNDSAELNGIGLPENYYAWTWGDALFVVLDVYRFDCDTTPKPHNWDWSLGIRQYKWLKATLESSQAKYKFVFAHHTRGEGRGGILTALQNEWGGYQNATGLVGNNYTFPVRRPASEGWTKPIHQLFKDNKVSVFFQGHDHVFAHEMLDSITYQALPMAADSTYKIGMLANSGAYVSDTLDGSGHIRVTVNPAFTTVDFVRAYLPKDTLAIHKNREVAFSYKIRAKDTYVFSGSGNWSNPDNWLDKAVPPAVLPAGYSVYIAHPAGGQCLLDSIQRMSPGSNLIIQEQRKLIIPGELIIL